MPKYFEFVFAAYGVWAAAFAAYFVYLFQRHRAVRRALDRLQGRDRR